MEHQVRDIDIFRLKESPATVFVSEKFKVLVEESKLKGFDFGEVVSISSES
ncbi:imm11 family protein [Burkholderia gladioli]|uniref:imm11 family protein n=1 Tax=Burkholderia gladioli TaxID=28095 RepID=UPI002FCA4D2B